MNPEDDYHLPSPPQGEDEPNGAAHSERGSQ